MSAWGSALGGLCLVAALLSTSTTAHAERPSEAPPPSCLDQSIVDELGSTLRPRGVQAREFLKRGHVALTARGGLLGGDLLSSSWIAGGALGFWITEDLGVELGLEVSPIALDADEPLADFFGDDRFEGSLGYLGLANVVWSPIHAKLRTGDGDVTHADITLAAGAGRLFHDSSQGVAFDVGVALEIFTTGWITLRVDLRDLVLIQEAVAETRLTNNLVATVGLSFWIPTGL